MPGRKISIIGAGNVGATTAHITLNRRLGDVVLIHVAEGIAKGKALDLTHGMPIDGANCSVRGSADIAETAGSDLVIITAGLARKPGMTREELLGANAKIVGGIAENAAAYSPDAALIVATNPLDVMTYLALKKSGFERGRVLGMAGVLDSARFASFIASELGVSHDNIKAMVLGSHGETMVPLPRYSTVSGIPITELMHEKRIEEAVKHTRNAGAEIVALLQQGSAYYSPAMALAEMAECVLKDKKKILPCSVLLEGEYGHKDVCIGVPVRVGALGAEKVVELELNEKEKGQFSEAVKSIKGMISQLGI